MKRLTVILNGIFVVVMYGMESDTSKDINYLLVKDNYNIAYTTKELLPSKFEAVIKVECDKAIALRPVPKVFDQVFPWGIKHQIYVCNTIEFKLVP